MVLVRFSRCFCHFGVGSEVRTLEAGIFHQLQNLQKVYLIYRVFFAGIAFMIKIFYFCLY
jgi:hypothetical protein